MSGLDGLVFIPRSCAKASWLSANEQPLLSRIVAVAVVFVALKWAPGVGG